MMPGTVIPITLQIVASLLVIEGAISATIHNQKGCHNTNVILDCPHYTENKPGKLEWIVKDKSTNLPILLARITDGNRMVYSASSHYKNRLTIHRNGSLEITSLRPDDETQYKCLVKQGGRKLHVVKLNVTCGKVTLVKREVCVEEDVVLECVAKRRTNPRKLKQVKWHKKNSSGTDVSWSLLAAFNGSNVVVGDGFMLHGNGSLLLHGGRDENEVRYKCDVTKITNSRLDRHIIVVKNVKCQREKRAAATIKTTKGRVSMTTASPMKGTNVSIASSTPASVKQTSIPSTSTSKVCGGFLRNPVGTFQSPNYPSAYPANSHCKWTISAPQGYAAINITLDHVNIEKEDNCQSDSIAIYDELDNQVGCRLCGTPNSAIKIQVKGRVAVVVFRSDSSIQETGFTVSYKSALTVGKQDP